MTGAASPPLPVSGRIQLPHCPAPAAFDAARALRVDCRGAPCRPRTRRARRLVAGRLRGAVLARARRRLRRRGGVRARPDGDVHVPRPQRAGSQVLLLELGCQGALPISLATPVGRLPIGPGSADVCGFTCDEIYAGHVTPGACSDCGGGDFKSLAPGDVADIAWDRRVYAPSTRSTPLARRSRGPAPPRLRRRAVVRAARRRHDLSHEPALRRARASRPSPERILTIDTTGAQATIDVGP